MKTCPTCHFWNGKICTDPKDFFDADGASVCRYHSDAVEAQPKRKPINGVLELTEKELKEFSKIISESDKIKKVRLDSVGGIEYILTGGSMWLCVYEIKAILYLANLFDLEVNDV